jgi:hypothetical protein
MFKALPLLLIILTGCSRTIISTNANGHYDKIEIIHKGFMITPQKVSIILKDPYKGSYRVPQDIEFEHKTLTNYPPNVRFHFPHINPVGFIYTKNFNEITMSIWNIDNSGNVYPTFMSSIKSKYRVNNLTKL